jgi:arylsulfatase A-like enzyme
MVMFVISRVRTAAMRFAFAAIATLVIAPITTAADAGSSKPNIVFLLSDDQGYADVGWHGTEIKTPNLDKIAAAGARLDAFYAQPVCSPTRAALMTGRYPMRHGLQVGVVRPWADYGLPLNERTLPQALSEAGYETAICGKWHLGHVRPDYLPTHRGFQHQYGHYNGALDYFTHVRDGGFDWHRDDRACHDEGYSTALLATEAARLIHENGGKRPLFLYVPFNAVHAPHQVPEQYKKPYAHLKEPRRTYAGMVAAMDEACGKIVAAVEEAGMRKNTLFVFSTDNGGPSPGRVTSNGPLRAGKATLYEGGVRVCAACAWDGHVKPGTVVNEPIHMVDWYPTLLKLAGASADQPLPLDGKDVWPTIAEGKPSPHEEILNNVTPTAGAIRVGSWKLVLNGHRNQDQDADGEAAPAKRAAGKEVIELFNLADDLGEKNNLAAQMPEKVKDLRARLDRYSKEQVPPKGKPKAKDFQTPKVWGEK